jgi:hypothetical protein
VSAVPERSGRTLALTLLAGLPVLLAVHAYSFGRVPPGLESGVAVEALRGVHLVVKRRFEVMTFAIGPSAETLWLYVVGAAVEILGPRWFSVVLPSVLAAAAVVALTVLVTARLAPGTLAPIPLLLSAGSVWLFHYGQVGLRAISAPLFFLLAVMLVDASEAAGASKRLQVAAGFVLGLSVYAYSSCRILALAWLLWRLAGEWRRPRPERRLGPALGPTLLGIGVASIPNLLFLMREPGEFLFRGYYVYRGGWAWKVANVFWTILLPFYHPRFYTNWLGAGHNFDPTAVSLTSAGVHPVDPVTAIACACGLVFALRGPRSAGLSYLLATLATGVLFLGISGPSLTRILLLQPALVILASLALGRAWRIFPRARLAVVAALLVPAASGAAEYAWKFGRSREAQREYLEAANAMSARARDLADPEPALRVMLVTRKGKDIAKFYNYRHIERISLVEGIPETPDVLADAVRRFQPGVVLLERDPGLAAIAGALGLQPAAAGQLFDEVRLPTPPPGAPPPEPGNIRRLWSDIPH